MDRVFPVKIQVYTFCYNEEDILPYIIEYWKKYATKVVVYDNGSTDNSPNILSQYDWIEVRSYDSNNNYNPEKILEIKNQCYKECIGQDVDYVMVCNIDEVLYYYDTLLNDLKYCKGKGIKVFNSLCYNIINTVQPPYTENKLSQDYLNSVAVKEDSYKKALLFDPNVEINLYHNGYTVSSEAVIEIPNIYILHYKMFSLKMFTKRQNVLAQRIPSFLDRKQYLRYGISNNTSISVYNAYKTKLFYNKKEQVIKFDKNNIYRIQSVVLKDNANIVSQINATKSKIDDEDLVFVKKYDNMQKRSFINNKMCQVVIPIYKEHITDSEKYSLKQVINVLGKKYEICLVCPDTLCLDEYYKEETNEFKFNLLKLSPKWFKNLNTYSQLCESADFYIEFESYDYMLIYQLDGWIFQDRLSMFITLGYDYYGSPWKFGNWDAKYDSVGNGGVSLRKISKFIEICEKLTDDDLKSKYADLEDLFFCKHVKYNRQDIQFNIAPVGDSAQFSLCANGMYFKTRYKIDRPMCVHAWEKYVPWTSMVNDYINEKYKNNDVKKVEKPSSKRLAKGQYAGLIDSYFHRNKKEEKPSIKQNLTEQNPIEQNPIEQKPIEQKPVEQKPVEKQKPVQKVIDEKPQEVKVFSNDDILWKICEDENGQIIVNNNYENKYIITITSWKKRIGNIVKVLTSIINGSENPDLICVNLAVDEFPNKEKDLSDEVNKFLEDNKNLIKINWLKNNTKVWKKSLPTLMRYIGANIICIDDDFIYPKDFLQTFKKAYEKHKLPITGVVCKIHERKNQHCGCASLDRLDKLGEYVYAINKSVYDTGDEDGFMTYCYMKNGIEMQYAGKMYHQNMQACNAIEGYSVTTPPKGYKLWEECKKLSVNNLSKVKNIQYKSHKNVLEGLSIIIAAYNTEKYIEETLDSIQSQDWCQTHDNYEILVGIDGCEKTLQKMKEIMGKYKNLTVLNMDSNMGTFVTANTLVSCAKYNKILRFDSDDLLYDNALSKIMKESETNDIIRYQYTDFSDFSNKRDRKNNGQFAYGSVLYDKSVFEKAGGYQNWKCSGDFEFFERVKNNFVVKEIKEPLYYHRIRQDSLMHASDTSMKSKYREELDNKVRKYNFKKGDNIYIKPDTNTYSTISSCVKVALCAIAKNENRYIKEWVEYYKSIGITKIYLYDNNNTDGEYFEDVINDYIQSGFVKVINKRGIEKGLVYDESGINLQPKCYCDCYETYGKYYDWMCFFDIDEFLSFNNNYNLQTFLTDENLDNYDTCIIPWEIYDDNGYIYYEDKPVQERFKNKGIKQRRGVKSIVRTGVNIPNKGMVCQIHTFRLEHSRICQASFKKVENEENWIILTESDVNKCNCILKHYVTKSLQEYIERQLNRHWGTRKSQTDKAQTLYDVKQKYYRYCKKTIEKEQYFSKYN